VCLEEHWITQRLNCSRLKMEKVKKVSQKEKEWMREEIQVIRKLIKQCEERQQRMKNIDPSHKKKNKGIEERIK